MVTVRMGMGVAPSADMEIPRAALFHGAWGIDDARPKGFGALVDCDRGARDHVLCLAAAGATAERHFAGIVDEAMPPGFAAIGQAEHRAK